MSTFCLRFSVLLLFAVSMETTLSHKLVMSREQLTHEVEQLRELGNRMSERVDTLTEEKAALSSEVERLTEEGAKLKEEGAVQGGKVKELRDTMENLTRNYQRLKEKAEQSVYFTAYVTSGRYEYASAGHVIRFAQVVENTGNAYNPHTGAFTAPYDGGYMFFVSVDVSSDYDWLKISRNGQDIILGDQDGSDRQITTGVVTSLTAGDTVTVVHCCSRGYIDPGKESVFVGFRVR